MLVLCSYEALVRDGGSKTIKRGSVMVDVKQPVEIYEAFIPRATEHLRRLFFFPERIKLKSYLPHCGEPMWEMH